MRFTRSILVLFFLLAQAWPLQAAGCVVVGESCGMACCAEAETCDCVGETAPLAPLAPPAAPEREMMPAWIGFAMEPAPLRTDRRVDSHLRVPPGTGNWAHSAVSLRVLYHSFLN